MYCTFNACYFSESFFVTASKLVQMEGLYYDDVIDAIDVINVIGVPPPAMRPSHRIVLVFKNRRINACISTEEQQKPGGKI